MEGNWQLSVRVGVRVTLRLTVSQSFSHSVLALADIGCSQDSCGIICHGATSLTGYGVCLVKGRSLYALLVVHVRVYPKVSGLGQ